MDQNVPAYTINKLIELYAHWQQNATQADGKFSEFLELHVQNFQMEEEGYTMCTKD